MISQSCTQNNKKCCRLPKMGGVMQHLIPNAPTSLLYMLQNFKCALCAEYIPNLNQAMAHFNGDRHHLSMVNEGFEHEEFTLTNDQLKAVKTGVLMKEITPNLVQVIDPITEAKMEEINLLEEMSELDMEYCTLCSINFVDNLTALRHYGGKKHRKNYFKKFNNAPPLEVVDNEFHCKVCNVTSSSSEQVQLHLGSKAHQNRLGKVKEENNMRTTPPDHVARIGVIDFNAEPDDSFQPFGIPKPLLSTENLGTYGLTPHIRLDEWWHKSTANSGAMNNPEETMSRIDRDRYVKMSKDALRDYLNSVYK